MHMQLVLYLGVRGLFSVPFPVFVELAELVGTIRLRLQMIPEPPFMKEATFTFVGYLYRYASKTSSTRVVSLRRSFFVCLLSIHPNLQ
jgi:hypothetical protein